MEQIKIFFFALASFFGVEDAQIAADKTTVTIYPKTQEIEIVQEDLFTIIQSEKDTLVIREQFDNLKYWKEKQTPWAKELDSFPAKNLTFSSKKNTIKTHLKLTYSKEKDLRNMGIWYNAEKNQFSINYIPRENIKTKDGKLVDNYWVFDGDTTFSFTVEPFLEMPEKYKKLKTPIGNILIHK